MARKTIGSRKSVSLFSFYVQSLTQSPQASWLAGARRERLWGEWNFYHRNLSFVEFFLL